jgi:hypothetical protein
MSGALSRQAAQTECEGLNGHLAAIESASELDTVGSLLESEFWTGLYAVVTGSNKVEWKWADGRKHDKVCVCMCMCVCVHVCRF